MKIQIKTRTGLTTMRIENISAITRITQTTGEIHMTSGTIFQCVENLDTLMDTWESEYFNMIYKENGKRN